MDYSQLGRTPIPGSQSAGVDVRYDPNFDVMQAEIDKLASPTAMGTVDWPKIVAAGANILSTRSKDLTVAAYLAVGLISEHKIDGLHQGLQIIQGLLEQFWDDLFPPQKRMRGRVAALTWWAERLEVQLRKLDVPPQSIEKVRGMADTLRRIDQLLSQLMPDPPSLISLRRWIEALPVEPPLGASAGSEAQGPTLVTEHNPTVVEAPLPKPLPSVQAQEVDKAADSVGSEPEARRAVDLAVQKLRQASLFFLQQDLKNPLAYRYRRMAGWSRQQALPPHVDGVTKFMAPPPQVIAVLKAQRDEGQWPALIQNAEQRLSQFIFWFDLNRFVVEGLTALGPEHQEAVEAVNQETAYLLQRLPGVEGFRFVDGTPLADDDTRQWLQSIGFSGQAAVGPTMSVSVEDRQSLALPEALQQARDLVRQKKILQAVVVLQQQLKQCVSGRDQMGWRLAIARVLMESKKIQAALPHLDQILSDIDRFGLDQWDPVLAVDGWTLAWSVYSNQGVAEHKSRATNLLQRIARIDPVAALKLSL